MATDNPAQFDPSSLGALVAQNPQYANFFKQTDQGGSRTGQEIHPLLGALMQADPNMFNQMMPNHPRLAGILGGAALGAAAVPGIPGTAGAGIQGVASAISTMPYAKMMQAYQMMQPATQMAELQSKIGLQNAQAQGELDQGVYYRGMGIRAAGQNQTDIDIANINAAAKPRFDTTDRLDSKGRPWRFDYQDKKYRYFGGGEEPTEGPIFPPDNNSGGAGTEAERFVAQKNQELANLGLPPMSVDEKLKFLGENVWKPQAGWRAEGSSQATQPIRDENARRTQRDAADSVFVKSTTMLDKEIDALKGSQIPGAYDAPDMDAFIAAHKSSLKQKSAAIRSAYSKYSALPENNIYKRTGNFEQYFNDQQGQPGPTAGATSRVPPDAQSIAHDANGKVIGYRDKNGKAVVF